MNPQRNLELLQGLLLSGNIIDVGVTEIVRFAKVNATIALGGVDESLRKIVNVLNGVVTKARA